MFKFLQRSDKSSVAAAVFAASSREQIPDNDVEPVLAAAGAETGPFEGKASDDFEPQARLLGVNKARAALARVSRSRPCSVLFIACPRTLGHVRAVRELLAETVATLDGGPAVVLGPSYDAAGGWTTLQMVPAQAEQLAADVAEAVMMLSVTLPAAFASDSYEAGRVALEEELRSGHDAALDALKRKAQAQNIGILRTPQGFAVAPTHEGRVVASDVFKALPDSLKVDVEAKLQAVESELTTVLGQRSTLQHDYFRRSRELDREVATLSVKAAFGPLRAAHAGTPAVANYLDAMAADATRNAGLFVAAAREAGGFARAPAELAADRRLARYRLDVIGGTACLIHPRRLERADLYGSPAAAGSSGALAGVLTAAHVQPGVLSAAGGGLVVVDARDLLASFDAWPLLKRALVDQAVTVADGVAGTAMGAPAGLGRVNLPIAARLVVVGDGDEFVQWCQLDSDVARMTSVIPAFEGHVARSADAEREFAGVISRRIKDGGLLPFDGPAIAALMHERTELAGGTAQIATDFDGIDDVLTIASDTARARAVRRVEAADILAALKARGDDLNLGAATAALRAGS